MNQGLAIIVEVARSYPVQQTIGRVQSECCMINKATLVMEYSILDVVT